MKKWLVAILFGTVLTLGACGGGDDGADDNASPDGETVDTAAGEEVYKSSCASCHGGDLTGQSGPALDTIGDKYTADEIEDIVENGTGSMPAQSQVSDDDRAEVASWLADKK